MKQIVFVLLFLITVPCFAGSGYYIQAKGADGKTTTINGITSLNKNNLNGNFRLIEYIPENMKVGATELVTFFISKQDEKRINLSLNCAKAVNLHYTFSDQNGKHKLDGKISNTHRIEFIPYDLTKFKEGACTLSFYNDSNELLYTYEFEKINL
ncbi:MAG: hypothetical protein IPI46_08825 [Bacteroidetes bacterium]|nr:hypothetical protein [Bacteroidota bacterium]